MVFYIKLIFRRFSKDDKKLVLHELHMVWNKFSCPLIEHWKTKFTGAFGERSNSIQVSFSFLNFEEKLIIIAQDVQYFPQL